MHIYIYTSTWYIHIYIYMRIFILYIYLHVYVVIYTQTYIFHDFVPVTLIRRSEVFHEAESEMVLVSGLKGSAIHLSVTNPPVIIRGLLETPVFILYIIYDILDVCISCNWNILCIYIYYNDVCFWMMFALKPPFNMRRPWVVKPQGVFPWLNSDPWKHGF